MKRMLVAGCLLAFMTISGPVSAGCCECQDLSFYFKVGSGVSCSEFADVNAPSPTWNPAIQGYNSELGNRAILDVGLGCQFAHLVALEASISNRSGFKYRKFQTPVSGGASYTREFDLDV